MPKSRGMCWTCYNVLLHKLRCQRNMVIRAPVETQITSQRSDYVTKIRLLNKDLITSQRSDYVTKIRLLKKDSITKQRSDYVTKIRLLNKDQITKEGFDY